MKTCFKCKQTKDLSLFFKHNITKDGFHSWCKECCKNGNKKSLAKKNSTIEGRASIFIRNAKNSAAKRKQEFSITLQNVVDAWNAQGGICPYSGREMTLEAGHHNTVSIERIDSNIGYTPENTILICQAINRMKSNFEYNDFYNFCRDVTKFLGDKDFKLSVGGYK